MFALRYNHFLTPRPSSMTDIMGGSPLQIAAWFTPMALGGIIISTVGGLLLHRIPGTIAILLSGTAWIVPPLLFALAPPGATYWKWTFPAMVCATLAIDVTFTVTNVFVSHVATSDYYLLMQSYQIANSLPLRFQGLAGALINTLVMLGVAVFLGLADVIAANMEHLGKEKAYKSVFWFEVGCAAAALVILVFFVKIDAARSGLTADEKAERKVVVVDEIKEA